MIYQHLIQTETLAESSKINKIILLARLKKNIGNELFEQLSDEQKDLMIKTAGIIHLSKKINIKQTYKYYEDY